LKPWELANDFAPYLTFSSERTRTRRDHDKYLTLIESIALLHQHQRPTITREVKSEAGQASRLIEMLPVTIEDIALANQIAPEVLGRSLDELPPQTRRLLGFIRELVKAMMDKTNAPQSRCLFSRRELCQSCGWSYAQVRAHIERLSELEYIVPRHGRNGTAMSYELLMDAAAPEQQWHIGLIDVATLKARHYDGNLEHPAPHLEQMQGDLAEPCESGPSRSEAA
jgi:hypothetical protein